MPQQIDTWEQAQEYMDAHAAEIMSDAYTRNDRRAQAVTYAKSLLGRPGIDARGMVIAALNVYIQGRKAFGN